MLKLKFISTIILVFILISGCKSGSQNITVCPEETEGAVAMLPQAIIYRTQGDYRLNVPITLDASKTKVVSFPAPTDISSAVAPIELVDGWMLDRRGISPNSVFTSYLYDEYAQLAAPPTIHQLLESIINFEPFTEIRRLPMTTAEAAGDTAKCNQIIRYNLNSCPLIYTTNK